MPLSKLQFQSGIAADVTGLSAMGTWRDADKVRFRKAQLDKPSYPEKIGGWRHYNTNTYLGECDSLHWWYSLDSTRYMGVETSLKAYVESSGTLLDITPIRRTATLGANPFLPTGSGSNVVTVTDVAHGAQINDFVTYSGATGGQITAGVINAQYQVASVIDADHYTIVTSTTVNVPGVAFGGAAVSAAYQIPVGVNALLSGTGWGSGTWGRGTWGSAFSSGTTYIFRVWSQDNFGEDLIILPNYDQLYLWQPSLGFTASNRAVAISSLPGANSVPTSGLLTFVTDDRHVVLLGSSSFADNSTLDPMLVRWGSTEDFLDWEPRTDNTAGEYRLSTGSTCVAYCKTVGGGTLIWTDKALYSMQFSGPPYVFGFTLISADLAIMGPRASVGARNSVYWMDKNQFFLYNGSVIPIQCPVLAHVFDDFNYDQRYKVAAGVNSAFNEIWWFYPSASSNVNDRYVSLNFLTGEWVVGKLSREAWVDQALDGLPVGAYNGNLYQHEYGTDDDGAAMDSFIESGDMDIIDGQSFAFVKRIIPDFLFQGANQQVRLIIKGRDYPDLTLREKANVLVLPETEQRHVRIRDRQVVVRIENDVLSSAWRLGTLSLDVQPDGLR